VEKAHTRDNIKVDLKKTACKSVDWIYALIVSGKEQVAAWYDTAYKLTGQCWILIRMLGASEGWRIPPTLI
jgi:DMSO/TMAO reductase YedYZ molybdopterin-dependent catalytic subunit